MASPTKLARIEICRTASCMRASSIGGFHLNTTQISFSTTEIMMPHSTGDLYQGIEIGSSARAVTASALRRTAAGVGGGRTGGRGGRGSKAMMLSLDALEVHAVGPALVRALADVHPVAVLSEVLDDIAVLERAPRQFVSRRCRAADVQLAVETGDFVFRRL